MFFRNLLLNLLLAVGALALVAGTAIVVLRISHSSGANTGEAQHPAILVATHAIESGSLLRQEDVTWKDVDAGAIAPDNLVRGRVSSSDYSGAVVRRSFASGEALAASAIVKPSDRGFLAAVLAPGDRAVTITASPSQSASGLVLPGDYVDVILTQNFDSYTTDPARKTVGETVLHNVRVIAVDKKLTNAPDTTTQQSVGIGVAATVKLPKTITLEVNEQQAQRLMVANSLGHIDLALRALQTPSTGSLQAAGPTWASDVSPALSDLRRPAPTSEIKHGGTAPHATAAPATVRILRGSKTETQ